MYSILGRGNNAIIVFNPDTGKIMGTLKTKSGQSFSIERCSGEYFLKEYDVQKFADEEGNYNYINYP